MTGAVTAVQVGSSPRCRSCQAPLWFGRTLKGKRMPIDPQPVEDGNVIVDQDMRLLDKIGSAYVGDAPPPEGVPVRVLRKGEQVADNVPKYKSHFATCPRKKARASATPADRAAPSAEERRPAAPSAEERSSAGIGGAQGRPFGEVGMVLAPPTSTGDHRG